MLEVYEFLKSAGTYYLATMDGDQPRVRPFGTIDLFEDRLYIQTGKRKPVADQGRSLVGFYISSSPITVAVLRTWIAR